jgi:hypothetical protein
MDRCSCRYTVGAQRFRSFLNQSLPLLCFLVPSCFSSRVMSTHVTNEEKRSWFYDMQNTHLCIPRMDLRDYGLYGRLGEFGVINCEQNPHKRRLSSFPESNLSQNGDEQEKTTPIPNNGTAPTGQTVRVNIITVTFNGRLFSFAHLRK